MNRDGWVFVSVLLCVTAIAFYLLGMRDGASLGVQCPEANAGERLTSSDQTSCQYVHHMSYGQAMRKVRVVK